MNNIATPAWCVAQTTFFGPEDLRSDHGFLLLSHPINAGDSLLEFVRVRQS